MPTPTVMPYETALEYLQKFTALGLPVLIRPRSWNAAQGKNFWALEVAGSELINAARCEAKLAELTPPMGVNAEVNGAYFIFRLPDGSYLKAPDNDTLWNSTDIANATRSGNAYVRDGKRYLLLPPKNMFHTATS